MGATPWNDRGIPAFWQKWFLNDGVRAISPQKWLREGMFGRTTRPSFLFYALVVVLKYYERTREIVSLTPTGSSSHDEELKSPRDFLAQNVHNPLIRPFFMLPEIPCSNNLAHGMFHPDYMQFFFLLHESVFALSRELCLKLPNSETAEKKVWCTSIAERVGGYLP